MKILTFLNISIAALLFISCTEEIDLDLNSSDPQIVVEGGISENNFAKIIISKSINFDQSNVFPAVEHAVVVLSDNSGITETLNETSAGVYESTSLKGTIGNSYSLKIYTDGKTLTSNSTIPLKVSFDSITLTKITGQGGGGMGGHGEGPTGPAYQITVQYSDPINQNNYYRFLEYVNGVVKGDYIFDDRLNNGSLITSTLRNFNRDLKIGDTLTIEMQCIDKDVYNYFNSFSNLEGGPQNSSTPANPYTNIIGSKLGYFSAHTSEFKSIIITE